jgi:hypothetical protein
MSPQQPQTSLEVDLLRPVLLMPPVILMDGGSAQNSPQLNINSVPPSPIIDFPPSPAPSQHPVVEFPAEDDVYEYDEDGFVVEVRKSLSISLCCGFQQLTKQPNKNLQSVFLTFGVQESS